MSDVQIGYGGAVRVDGWLVAPEFSGGTFRVCEAVAEVRRRTPTDWWERARDADEAQTLGPTGGPLGSAVDFFVGGEEWWPAFTSELCAEIEEEAADAAREVILARIDEHLRRVVPVGGALSIATALLVKP